jgi:mono/diheme cytochrome c family protein
MTRALLLALATAVAGCNGCNVDLERMIVQPRFQTWVTCEVCPQGTIMMLPPPGTVARSEFLGPEEVTRGRVGDFYVQRIPIVVDRQVLARGRNRFEIFCGACHGRLGNGLSQVSENMTLRMPPDLHAEPWRSYPPGRVFEVVTEGFGLMRSYADVLPVGDRWAVVAYLEALRLSQNARLDQLPAPVQQEVRRWTR